MSFSIKKFLLIVIYNSSLLLFLIIGIQNSTNKGRVNLIFNETVNLPIGFILGLSFITGSITASFLSTNTKDKKE